MAHQITQEFTSQEKGMMRNKLNYDLGFSCHKGYAWDDFVAKKCDMLGMEVKMLGRQELYDMKINGHKVLVSAALPRPYPTKGHTYSMYRFRCSKGDRTSFGGQYDFLVCVLMDFGQAFIIPGEKLNPGHQLVGITWPNNYNHFPKYAEYFENWDLLKGK